MCEWSANTKSKDVVGRRQKRRNGPSATHVCGSSVYPCRCLNAAIVLKMSRSVAQPLSISATALVCTALPAGATIVRVAAKASMTPFVAAASSPKQWNRKRSKLEETEISMDGAGVGVDAPVYAYEPPRKKRSRISFEFVATTRRSTGRPIFLA